MFADHCNFISPEICKYIISICTNNINIIINQHNRSELHVLQGKVEAREDVVLHYGHGSWTEFLMFGEGPVVSSFEGALLTLVGCEPSVLILVVNGLLAVSEHSTTAFTGVAAFLPMDVFLVLVENNVGDESLVTFVTRLSDAHVYSLYVLLQSKFTFPEVSNEFF